MPRKGYIAKREVAADPVYSSTLELMEYPQIKSIAIIAEGVPERVSLLFKVEDYI